MKKVLTLIKKDVLLDRNNMIMIVLFSVAIPVFVGTTLGPKNIDYGIGLLAFMMETVYCMFFGQNKVSALEYKYKGAAYLSLTPYGRKTMVLAKYGFLLCLFVICLLCYLGTSLFVEQVPQIGLVEIGAVALMQIVFWSLYIPLEYKLGYNNIKVVFGIIFIAVPWIVTVSFTHIKTVFLFFNRHLILAILGIGVFAILILWISVTASIRIFEKKSF